MIMASLFSRCLLRQNRFQLPQTIIACHSHSHSSLRLICNHALPPPTKANLKFSPRPLSSSIEYPRQNLLRHVSTSSPKALKQKQATTPKAQPPKPKQGKTPSSNASEYKSYAQTLAEQGITIPLYVAPSHTQFTIFSYSGAVFCLTYAYYNLTSVYLHPPPDLHYLVPYAFGVICFMMAALGGYFLVGPTRIIRRITAEPVPVPQGQIPRLELEVELRKMLAVPDFIYPRRILSIAPEEFVREHQLYTPPPSQDPTLSPKDKALLQALEDNEVTSGGKYSVSRFFFSIFQNVGRTFHKAGFMQVEIKGQKYKLDIMDGWVLEQGRALDRLTRTKKGM